jgi:transcriptional activator SPT8
MSEFSAVPTTNEEEEEEDDDLFEDATEEPVQDDVVMDEVPEQEQEAEGEAEEEEEEGEEEENDAKQGGESGGEDNELLQQLEDSMMREDEDGEEEHQGMSSFKRRNPIRPGREMVECTSYDIVPYVACLHASPVYCVDFSWGLKWMFTGGADGFIRKYNFYESVNNKLPLTVAQRHPFVDSITRSGVCVSYWENEQPTLERDVSKVKDSLYEPKLSPVYSMAVQSEALWLLAGLESGGITLQSVRHNEGQIQAYLDKHKSAVSVLKLDDGETRAISGSWDKTIVEWDLNNGKPFREFLGSSGQVAALEWQPVGGSLVSRTLRDQKPPTAAVNGKRNSNSGAGAGADDDDDDRKSLGSLFGDEDEEDDDQGEGANVKREEKPSGGGGGVNEEEPPGRVQTSQSVFLSASIDGTVDIWDRRQERKAGHLYVPQGVPPWCTSACWSTDGNCIFVGRRNSTVDEFDIRTSLTKQTRSFKFPSVSGAVSNVRAMPSGRHLLCGSHDNVRLYDLQASPKSKTPFYIVPGHHGAVLSSIHVDPSCQFMVTTSGNRGWQGNSTDVALIYEIEPQ